MITGATSGIGLALAEYFYKENNQVIVCGRRKDRLEKLKAKYPNMETILCDISQVSEREKLFDDCKAKFPEINILVNNAGIQLATKLTRPVDLDLIYRELDTNLVAPIHLSSLFVEQLAAAKDPAIINISSALAYVPLAFIPVYCASKAALHSYTLSLRHQLRHTPIKVFEVIPPAVDTELGYQRRADPHQSHGGIPVSSFLQEAVEALLRDEYEAAV